MWSFQGIYKKYMGGDFLPSSADWSNSKRLAKLFNDVDKYKEFIEKAMKDYGPRNQGKLTPSILYSNRNYFNNLKPGANNVQQNHSGQNQGNGNSNEGKYSSHSYADLPKVSGDGKNSVDQPRTTSSGTENKNDSNQT